MEKRQTIILRHYFISGERCIGILFYPNKVLQALVKELPGVSWSKQQQVIYVPNTPEHLNSIYEKFRGVAWINGRYFYRNKPVNTQGDGNGDINWVHKRKLTKDYRSCPDAYLQKLQLNPIYAIAFPCLPGRRVLHN